VRLLLDEDSQGRLVARLLRESGHDVVTVADVGLESHLDAEVFAFAWREGRVLLTRNIRDFEALHIAQPDHPGILAEHQDRDQTKNMSAIDIVQAIRNIEGSGWNIAGQFVAINAWNFAMRNDAEQH
jgi:predicted nuclease of predicted toxin-antitoxin system